MFSGGGSFLASALCSRKQKLIFVISVDVTLVSVTLDTDYDRVIWTGKKGNEVFVFVRLSPKASHAYKVEGGGVHCLLGRFLKAPPALRETYVLRRVDKLGNMVFGLLCNQ